MLLQYYHHSPGGKRKDQLTQIRDIIEAQFPDGNHMDVTNAQELEYSLSYYGKSSSAIFRMLTPSTATHVMEQMIAQGQPIIAFLDGTVLERPYACPTMPQVGWRHDVRAPPRRRDAGTARLSGPWNLDAILLAPPAPTPSA